MMIVPSPPGRWNARRSARANSITITPASTRNTAASTNETSPNALIECEWMSPVFLFRLWSPYHGKNIVISNPNAAATARRWSGAIARQPLEMRPGNVWERWAIRPDCRREKGGQLISMSSTSGAAPRGPGPSIRSTHQSMIARIRSSSCRIRSRTCRHSSGGTMSRSVCSSATSACASRAVCSSPSRRGSPASFSAASWVARMRSRRASSGSSVGMCVRGAIEPNLQGAVLELGAGGTIVAQRGRKHQRPLLPVDAHDQLEADLLERDVAARRERERHPQLGVVGSDHQLLRDRRVQHLRRVAIAEQLVAEAVEHRRPDDLLVEERRPQHRHGRERGLDLAQVLLLALAPAAEVVADLGGEDAVHDDRVGQV